MLNKKSKAALLVEELDQGKQRILKSSHVKSKSYFFMLGYALWNPSPIIKHAIIV